MRASTKRLAMIFASLLLLAGLFEVYNILLKPAYADIKTKRGELASRDSIIQENQLVLQKAQTLLSNYQNAPDIQRNFSLILPNKEDSSEAVNQFNGLARLSGLDINVLSATELAVRPSSQPSLVKGIGVTKFELRLTGAYNGFKKFIGYIETNLGIMNITDLRIESVDTKSANLNYLVTVYSYYQSE